MTSIQLAPLKLAHCSNFENGEIDKRLNLTPMAPPLWVVTVQKFAYTLILKICAIFSWLKVKNY